MPVVNRGVAAAAGLAVTVAAVTVAGCGFQLRGEAPSPPTLQLTADDPALAAALADHGVTVTAAAADTDTVTVVTATNFTRTTLTTDNRGRATAYTLRYSLMFTVAGDARTVTVTRALDYDPARELQTENEIEFLQRDMRRDAVMQLLQQLRRL